MQQQRSHSGIMVGLLSLGVLAITALTAGPAQADSVGPYYATPSWDQTLPSATRFIVLSNFINSAAVLDRNTGLVWEKAPATTTHSWFDARFQCANKNVGGQKGFRLPSMPELASLIDPSVSPGPTLPAGHPFTSVQKTSYWSATLLGRDPSRAWFVDFDSGLVSHIDLANNSSIFPVWCVRGGMNAEAY